MRSPSNPGRKVLLVFRFAHGPSVTIQGSRAVAELGKREGFKITHPVEGRSIMLVFSSIRPDFRRAAVAYEFLEAM